MSDKVFFDSNVLLYGLDNSSKKRKSKVYKLLRDSDAFISPQIVFECLRVATKKFKRTKKDSLAFINMIIQFAEIKNEDSEVVRKALELYSKHSLQVFDSKIIAAALLADCKILYSEESAMAIQRVVALKSLNEIRCAQRLVITR